MTRQQKDPLRQLTAAEESALLTLTRASSAPAAQVTRAKLILAVAAGQTYHWAAFNAGRRSPHAVAALVARFNLHGMQALDDAPGGGPLPLYNASERARILAEVQRTPDREQDGTASWSLTTLQRALRRAPDGLPHISRYTIWAVLRAAGWRWQRNRSWCPTGSAVRQRKSGVVIVHDPDAAPKKT